MPDSSDNAHPDHGKTVIHNICPYCGAVFWHMQGDLTACPRCARHPKRQGRGRRARRRRER